jgi:hypothetical protein
MCVYDVVAAAQQGACFRNLGRRLQLSEDETSRAVAAVLAPVSEGLIGWISRRDGMIEFLSALGADDLTEPRSNSAFFSDNRWRDRGIVLLRKWRDAGGLDSEAVAAGAASAGVKPDIVAQLLPWVAVLVMSAVQVKAQRPLGWIAGDMDGDNEAGNPFLFLARHLSGDRLPQRRPAVRRMLGSLLGIDGGGHGGMAGNA